MRRCIAQSFVVVTVLACVPSLLSAQTPAAGNTGAKAAGGGEKEIIAIEEQEAQAMLRGDVAALERLWSPDVLITPPRNAIRTGAEVLAFVRDGKVKYRSFERRVERVSVQDDVAVAMGTEIVMPTVGKDSGKTVRRRFTDVFARRSGEWRLIARHFSLAP